jgi:hypothetical protein
VFAFLRDGVKANVLHWVGFGRGDAALLILLKPWHFVFHFSVRLLLVVSSFRLRHNGLALGAVADFGAQNCQYTISLMARLMRGRMFN